MNKILKLSLICIFIIVLLIISFLITGTKKDNKDKNNNKEIKVEENELNSIVEYSESISPEERTSITKISIDEYLNLYKNDNNHAVLFYSDTCKYCKIAIPILENIIYKYGVEINGIDVANLTDDEKKKLVESNDFFKEGVSTPLIIIVSNDKIVDSIDGLTKNEDYQQFFKKYKLMK